MRRVNGFKAIALCGALAVAMTFGYAVPAFGTTSETTSSDQPVVVEEGSGDPTRAEGATVDDQEIIESEDASSDEPRVEETPEADDTDALGEKSISINSNLSSVNSLSPTVSESEETPALDEDELPSISVEAHVQEVGWMSPVTDGAVAGTTGRSLRLEALRFGLIGLPEGSGIEARAHVAEIGWQDAVGAGEVSGTEGESLAIEAITLKLTGPAADQYDVWYCVHSANYGWSGWAKNGEQAGTAGYGKRAEAVRVLLLPKGADAPGSTENAIRSPELKYRGHVAYTGWQSYVYDGSTAGTTGKSRALESLNVSLGPNMPDGSVELRAHVAKFGWQAWETGSCGTTGRSLAMEAIEIRLTGDVAAQYDVWYRVHVEDLGWLGWASNGDPAGTSRKELQMEAIQIVLLPKDSNAPGQETGAFQGSFESLSASGRLINNAKAGLAGTPDLVLGNSTGTTPLRSFGVEIKDAVRAGSISYRVRRSDSGWQTSSVADGSQTSSANDGLPINAIEMSLSGDVESAYDIWYRVSLVGEGWLGWASNGSPAGADDSAVTVNAIQMVLVPKGEDAPGQETDAYVSASVSDAPTIRYQAHVAELGWQSFAKEGETAGTTGESLALEALRVSLDGDVAGEVRVSAHVAKLGWLDFSQSPEYAGTVGETRPAEAFKIELAGDIAGSYDIYYRVHSSWRGWLGWAKNGEIAGTSGLSCNAEAIEIRLVKKGDAAPTSDAPAALEAPELSLQLHVQKKGWLGPVGNGKACGTTGQSLRAEGLKLSVESPISGGISYSAHVQDIGWQSAVVDGALAGTEGKSKRLEAVKISLTGDLSKYFDVWYRAYVQDYGWLGWTKNGQAAGTGDISYRLESLQVKITVKGSPAPGSTSRPYTEEPAMSAAQRSMVNKARGYSSNTKWLLMVDTKNCYVGIFKGSRGKWSQQSYWLCSVGASSTPTPTGVYTVKAKGYSFGSGYTCYYYTQFWGDYLFHSIKYDQGTFRVQDGRLGMHISHGCVRLPLSQAKWIQDNIPAGTKVVVYR